MTERSRRAIGRDMVSQIATIPAPVGGWNARDALEAMEPTDAITLENWIAAPDGVVLRMGNDLWATGLGGPVETIMEYVAPSSANRKAFAAAGTTIWDITTSVTAGGSPVSSLTGVGNARWQSTMITTPAGQYLYAVNGATAPRYWDGTTWATSTITGVTSSTLTNVALHKSRLWFCEANSLRAWYLPPLEIGASSSAANSINLGAFFRHGGSLAAIGTWTRDGGNGSDDGWVAISTEGEVALYTGTDPTSSSTWALVGVFKIPPPIGRRCLIKVGADLAVLTQEGIISLSESLPLPASAQRQASITDKINPAFDLAFLNAGSVYGWQVIEAAGESLVLVNVPQSATRVDQYVMNTRTGGWARWTGINAACIGSLGDRILWGMLDGTVWAYRRGQIEDHSDITTPITATFQTAFSELGRATQKRVTMIRPIIQGPRGYNPRFNVRVDYSRQPANLSSVPLVLGGAIWDVATWDQADWATTPIPLVSLQSASGFGRVISVAGAVQSDVKIVMSRFDIVCEPSQGIL